MQWADKKGFALLEALLAWSLLMIVILGIFVWQIDNLHKVQHSYFLSIATMQLQSMAERLRVNADASSRSREKQLWNLQNKEVLPKSEGNFICKKQICTITLYWQERDAQFLTVVVVL